MFDCFYLQYLLIYVFSIFCFLIPIHSFLAYSILDNNIKKTMMNHMYINQQTIIGYATLCAIFSAINLALQAVNESLQEKH